MSSWRSGGISTEIGRPMISAAVYPKRRSAAGFHEVMMPLRLLLMIASSDDSTIASERCARRISACGLFSSSGSEVVSIIGFTGLALSTLLDLSKTRTTARGRGPGKEFGADDRT